jgi:hypothetical protein
MLSAWAEALSEAKGKHLGVHRESPFAEFTLVSRSPERQRRGSEWPQGDNLLPILIG